MINFKKIESPDLPKLEQDIVETLSEDQKYLYKILLAVITGICCQNLAHNSPGQVSRWLTLANIILRLYISTENPSKELIFFANFITKIYGPMWFRIKLQGKIYHGAKNFFKMVELSWDMPEPEKKIMQTVLQHNAYFAHAENIIIAMLEDDQEHIRELGYRRILKARGEKQMQTVQNSTHQV
jgi:hypothetical protein